MISTNSLPLASTGQVATGTSQAARTGHATPEPGMTRQFEGLAHCKAVREGVQSLQANNPASRDWAQRRPRDLHEEMAHYLLSNKDRIAAEVGRGVAQRMGHAPQPSSAVSAGSAPRAAPVSVAPTLSRPEQRALLEALSRLIKTPAAARTSADAARINDLSSRLAPDYRSGHLTAAIEGMKRYDLGYAGEVVCTNSRQIEHLEDWLANHAVKTLEPLGSGAPAMTASQAETLRKIGRAPFNGESLVHKPSSNPNVTRARPQAQAWLDGRSGHADWTPDPASTPQQTHSVNPDGSIHVQTRMTLPAKSVWFTATWKDSKRETIDHPLTAVRSCTISPEGFISGERIDLEKQGPRTATSR